MLLIVPPTKDWTGIRMRKPIETCSDTWQNSDLGTNHYRMLPGNKNLQSETKKVPVPIQGRKPKSVWVPTEKMRMSAEP